MTVNNQPLDIDPVDLYEHAQTLDGPQIVTNRSHHVAVPGDHYGPSHDAVVLHRNIEGFIHALCQTALSAPLYDTYHEGEVHTFGTGILVDPSDSRALEYVRTKTSDSVRREQGIEFMGLRGHDGEYIDGYHAHKGLIFQEGDYRYVTSQDVHAVSEPMALANPDDHLWMLSESDPIQNVRFLDTSDIEDAGWSYHGHLRPVDRFSYRERLYEEDEAVVFIHDGDPFDIAAYSKSMTNHE